MPNNFIEDDKMAKIMSRQFLEELQRDMTELPIFNIEYEQVGYWKGLWLKLTGQKPRIIYPPLPKATSDTITFRRPQLYQDK